MKKRLLAAALAVTMSFSLVPAPAFAADAPAVPAAAPTAAPTAQPTAEPTAQPSAEPTAQPSAEPTAQPSAEPTAEPSAEPSAEPTAQPDKPVLDKATLNKALALLNATPAAGKTDKTSGAAQQVNLTFSDGYDPLLADYDKTTNTITLKGSQDAAAPADLTGLTMPGSTAENPLTIKVTGAVKMDTLTGETYQLVTEAGSSLTCRSLTVKSLVNKGSLTGTRFDSTVTAHTAQITGTLTDTTVNANSITAQGSAVMTGGELNLTGENSALTVSGSASLAPTEVYLTAAGATVTVNGGTLTPSAYFNFNEKPEAVIVNGGSLTICDSKVTAEAITVNGGELTYLTAPRGGNFQPDKLEVNGGKLNLGQDDYSDTKVNVTVNQLIVGEKGLVQQTENAKKLYKITVTGSAAVNGTITGADNFNLYSASGTFTVGKTGSISTNQAYIRPAAQLDGKLMAADSLFFEKPVTVGKTGLVQAGGSIKLFDKATVAGKLVSGGTLNPDGTITEGAGEPVIEFEKNLTIENGGLVFAKKDVQACSTDTPDMITVKDGGKLTVKGNITTGFTNSKKPSLTATGTGALVDVGGSIDATSIDNQAGTVKADRITAVNDITVKTGGSVTAKTDISAKDIESAGTLAAGQYIQATGTLTAKEGGSVKADRITAKSVTGEKNSTVEAADTLTITGGSETGTDPVLTLKDNTAKLTAGKVEVSFPEGTTPEAAGQQVKAPGLSVVPSGQNGVPGILYPTPAEGSQTTAPKFEGGQWTDVPQIVANPKPTTFDKIWYTAETTAKINYHIGDVLYGWFMAKKDTPDPAIYGSVTLTRPLGPDEPQYAAADPQPGADHTETITLTKDLQYTVREGSLIVELIPTALPDDFKKAGDYTLTVNYKGGSKTFPLTIVEGAKPQPPAPAGGSGSAPAPAPAAPLAAGSGYQTGDKANYALPIGLALLCFAGMAACSVLLVKPRRKQGEEN